MKNKFLNIFSWYGVVAILTAYALISFSIISTKSPAYLLLNLSGSLGIMLQAAQRKDAQPVVLNIIWATIAFIGIVGLL